MYSTFPEGTKTLFPKSKHSLAIVQRRHRRRRREHGRHRALRRTGEGREEEERRRAWGRRSRWGPSRETGQGETHRERPRDRWAYPCGYSPHSRDRAHRHCRHDPLSTLHPPDSSRYPHPTPATREGMLFVRTKPVTPPTMHKVPMM